MGYEETKVKKTMLSKQAQLKVALAGINTGSVIWFLAKRHKFGLVVAWAIVMTALVAVPQLPEILKSL